jgi:hypothetical protein
MPRRCAAGSGCYWLAAGDEGFGAGEEELALGLVATQWVRGRGTVGEAPGVGISRGTRAKQDLGSILQGVGAGWPWSCRSRKRSVGKGPVSVVTGLEAPARRSREWFGWKSGFGFAWLGWSSPLDQAVPWENRGILGETQETRVVRRSLPGG